MKRLIAAVLLAPVLAWSAPGQPVGFNFAAVPLMTFAQATYKTILSRDFVISPELVDMNKKVTISVKSIEPDKLPAFVDGLLLSQGITSELRGNIYYLDVVKPSVVPVSSAVATLAPVPEAELHQGVSGALPQPALVAEKEPDIVQVYKPLNRPSEFMVLVINAAYGGGYARAAGSQIVLSVPPARFDAVLALAQLLDIAPKTVEVSASFVEVARTSSSSRGVALVASVLGARFGAAVGSGGGSVSMKAANFELILDALDGDGRFKQVSNSRVVGDESEKMVLSVGDETPTIASAGKDNQGNAIQNIVYRPSGVILDVLPKVLGSGAVSLVVDGQISSFQPTINGVSGSPTLIKRQVKTSVSVDDGEVLIIGGLDDTKSASNNSGLAFLPRSWASRTGTDAHTDLVLILSAKVLKKPVVGDI